VDAQALSVAEEQVQSALEMAHSATARQNDLTTMLEESEQEQVRLQFEVGKLRSAGELAEELRADLEKRVATLAEENQALLRMGKRTSEEASRRDYSRRQEVQHAQSVAAEASKRAAALELELTALKKQVAASRTTTRKHEQARQVLLAEIRTSNPSQLRTPTGGRGDLLAAIRASDPSQLRPVRAKAEGPKTDVSTADTTPTEGKDTPEAGEVFIGDSDDEWSKASCVSGEQDWLLLEIDKAA